VSDPQDEQARLVYFSLTIATDLPACSPLYRSICLSIPQPLSSTDFASRVTSLAASLSHAAVSGLTFSRTVRTTIDTG
jgi:hypothetical protein